MTKTVKPIDYANEPKLQELVELVVPGSPNNVGAAPVAVGGPGNPLQGMHLVERTPMHPLVGMTIQMHLVPGWLIVMRVDRIEGSTLLGPAVWLDGLSGNRASTDLGIVADSKEARDIVTNFHSLGHWVAVNSNFITMWWPMRADMRPVLEQAFKALANDE